MEVKGDEFIRNLEIEKEKVRLKEETDSLNAQKQQTIFKSSTTVNNTKENQIFQELDDIKLTENSNNRQKYIVFAFALILLFLITIITIKLLQEPKNNDDFTSNEIITDQEINNLKTTTKKINKSLDIDKITPPKETIEIPIEKPAKTIEKKPIVNDLFEIEKPIDTETNTDIIFDKPKSKENTTKTEKKIIKKEIVKKEITKKLNRVKQKIKKSNIKEINLSKKLFIKNWYIQVGAFSKQPDKKLINKLKNANYPYITRKIKVKNRTFTKLLVGGYKTKKDAKKHLNKIRKLVKNPKSYILRLK